jgi:hypothetical protein
MADEAVVKHLTASWTLIIRARGSRAEARAALGDLVLRCLGSGRPLGGIIGLTILCVIVALCGFDERSNLTQRGKKALNALNAKYPTLPREVRQRR